MSDGIINYDDEAPTAEEAEEATALALIGAILDGNAICFDYHGMKVARDGPSIFCFDPNTGRDLGGRFLVESAEIADIEEWLQAKADFYGDTL